MSGGYSAGACEVGIDNAFTEIFYREWEECDFDDNVPPPFCPWREHSSLFFSFVYNCFVGAPEFVILAVWRRAL